MGCSETPGYWIFRVERIGNRWWMIDPDGYRHLQKVVVGVRLGTSERNKQAMLDKFGTEEKWIERTAQMIHSLGFSGTGSWSNEEAIASYNASHKEVLTRSIILNLMSGYGKKRGGTYQLPGNTGYPNQCIFVFDPNSKLIAMRWHKNWLRIKWIKTSLVIFRIMNFRSDPRIWKAI